MSVRICEKCSCEFDVRHKRARFCSRRCAGVAPNVPEDIWSRLQVSGPDECWPYLGYRNHDGYGRMTIGGTAFSAHRIAWEVANGRSAGEWSVLHSCDNPPCCNPAHLRLGSTSDNQRDCVSRGRRPSRKGMRHPLAKLTASDVQEIRRRRRAGERGKDLAHEFGVSAPTITGITRHADKHWSHV